MKNQMTRTYTSLLLAAVCVSCVAAKCEQDVINNIKALRKGVDDSSVLNLVGDYGVVYVSGSSSVPGGFSNSTCQLSTFYKDKDGKHRVGHNGILAGDYILNFKDGVELVIDPATGKVLRHSYIVYGSPHYDVTAYYSCSVSGSDVSVGSVVVAKSALQSPSTAKLVKGAEDALAKVGLKFGAPITPCYKKR